MLNVLAFIVIVGPLIVVMWAAVAYFLWEVYQDFLRSRRG